MTKLCFVEGIKLRRPKPTSNLSMKASKFINCIILLDKHYYIIIYIYIYLYYYIYICLLFTRIFVQILYMFCKTFALFGPTSRDWQRIGKASLRFFFFRHLPCLQGILASLIAGTCNLSAQCEYFEGGNCQLFR